MREGLIHSMLTGGALSWPNPPVIVGPGDDCAVLAMPETGHGGMLIATVDQVIEGRHFVRAGHWRAGELSWDLIARKAVARSISDIAAMGGRPLWALATGALPSDVSQPDAEALTIALHRWGTHWGCPIVGGDIASTSGPIVLTVTIVGQVGRPIVRSGARAGDEVFVTGRLGGSLASGRHATFEPRIVEGQWLASRLGPALHAMMDVSDGVGIDASRLGVASGVQIEIDGASLPLQAGVADWRAGASDGEDYELLFTAAPGTVQQMCGDHCAGTGTGLTRIGRVVSARDRSEAGCVVLDPAGGRHEGAALGWEHGR
jgi:thiamine-monophosphate kinase